MLSATKSLKNFFILSLTLHLGVIMFMNFDRQEQQVQTLSSFALTLGTSDKLVSTVVPKQVQKKQIVSSGPALKSVPEIVEVVAPSEASQSALVGDVGSPDGTDSPQARYNSLIAKIINQHKHYPRMARALHHEGRVMVKMTLDKEGKLIGLELVETSSFESLSKAAMDTIRKVGKFPPIPQELGMEVVTFNVPIDYKITF